MTRAVLGRLIGSSRRMQETREAIARAAACDLTVLITGPSGSGKELAARALHELGARNDGPFVAENCAALPESLVEAELFGYRKGAFTGASRDGSGVFQRAHRGTLLLDEIGEMPAATQSKLLRVIETGEVRRIGDSETRRLDFRLVAATNRDLEEEVEERRFRADLLYRLDALRIEMPMLEDRVEDIPLLVEHFCRMHADRSRTPRTFSRAVVDCLTSREWPGNVRELANEVFRLCVLSPGPIVDDPELVRMPRDSKRPKARTDGPGAHGPDKVASLEDVERRAIETALQAVGGNRAEAARILGISRSKLFQRLRDWREEDAALSRSSFRACGLG